MAFLTKADLASVMYEGKIDKISGGDDSKVADAINAAMAQASAYLTAYNLPVIFALEGSDRTAYADLMQYLKDIAKWHFIAVCNAEVDLELAELRYKAAIAELAKLGRNINPNWPTWESDAAAKDLAYGSNRKQNPYF